MTRKKIVVGVVSLGSLAIVLMAIPQPASTRMASSPSAASRMEQQGPGDAEPIPAFHSQVPAGPLPATLDPQTFPSVLVQNAYALAARVRKVLYQQPCYCHCDRSQGHGSLLDCFAGKHAAECGVCIREGLYSYEQTRKGKTPAQIREGIVRGDWQQVDLTKYQTPIPATNPAK
jgi:Protein of unknown function with PCYCGC motif